MVMLLMTGQTVTAELCKRQFFWCWPDNCRLSQLSVCLMAWLSLIIQIGGEPLARVNTFHFLHERWDSRKLQVIALLSKDQLQK